MEIRDYQRGDFEQIQQLWVDLGLGNAKRGDNEQVIEQTIEVGGRLIVLCDNSLIIGTSWLTTDARRLYLHHFGIQKQYQGKKLSLLLLKESLNYAKKLNLQIKLEVHKNNTIATNLYVKANFEYLGDYNVYIVRDLNKISI